MQVKLNRIQIFVTGFTLAFLTVGVVSYVDAAGDTKIKVCANKKTGELRYPGKRSCNKRTETTLSLNQKGQVGQPGMPGATGPAGLAGATGPAGLAGTTGPAGLAGTTGPAGLAGATGPAGPKGNTGLLDAPLFGIQTLATDVGDGHVLATALGIDGLPVIVYRNFSQNASVIKCLQTNCSEFVNTELSNVLVSGTADKSSISFDSIGNPILMMPGDGRAWTVFCSVSDCSSYTVRTDLPIGPSARMLNGRRIIFTTFSAWLCLNEECSDRSEITVDESQAGGIGARSVIIDRLGRPVFVYIHNTCCNGLGNAVYTLKIKRCTDSSCGQVDNLFSTSTLRIGREKLQTWLTPKGQIQAIWPEYPVGNVGPNRIRMITCDISSCSTPTIISLVTSDSFEFRYFDAIRNRLTSYFNFAFIDEDLIDQKLWFRTCTSVICDDESTYLGDGYRGLVTGQGVDGLPYLVTTSNYEIKFIRCNSQDCVPYSR